MTRRRKGRKAESQFEGLSAAEVQAIYDDPDTPSERRRKALTHLKNLRARNVQKRRSD
jgi:hypothetical protein